MVSINLVSKPLITPAAPYGIISYELAGTRKVAGNHGFIGIKMLACMRHLALGFDYLFMLLYSTTIALACLCGESGDAIRPLARLWIWEFCWPGDCGWQPFWMVSKMWH